MDDLLLFVRRDGASEAAPVRLMPDTYDFELPDNESLTLDFRGPGAQLLESRHFEYPGELIQLQPGFPRFNWKPIPEPGDAAFGWLTLKVLSVGPRRTPMCFHVKITTSWLGQELWSCLFDDVRRVADALVSEWQGGMNPRLGGLARRAAHFSPATAMAEIDAGWSEFATSLSRISRSPRTDFRVSRPQQPRPDSTETLPEPVRDARTYENALVALTAERLERTLRHVRRRAERTMVQAQEQLAFTKQVQGPHAAEAQQKAQAAYEASSRIASKARERATFLRRTRRGLPGGPIVSSLRGRIPHVTPRVRHHPDYSRVVGYYRVFGHQQLAYSSQDFLSALGTRRASKTYEYWSLFALFSALRQLGYTPRFQQVSELIREDVLNLELWSDRPVTFVREDEAETITIWYERKARFLPQMTKSERLNAWPDFVKTNAPKAPPGLYSRIGSIEPDFWFELRQGERLAVGVGDAVFSEGVEAPNGPAANYVLKKADKLRDNYVQNLVLVDAGRRIAFPQKHGLVVFCGNVDHVPTLQQDRICSFLPLRPVGPSPEVEPGHHILLQEGCLDLLNEFLLELRKGLD